MWQRKKSLSGGKSRRQKMIPKLTLLLKQHKVEEPMDLRHSSSGLSISLK